jgi:hypothetical protein
MRNAATTGCLRGLGRRCRFRAGTGSGFGGGFGGGLVFSTQRLLVGFKSSSKIYCVCRILGRARKNRIVPGAGSVKTQPLDQNWWGPNLLVTQSADLALMF